MARKTSLTAGVAVILGGVLAATPAQAAQPVLDVVDPTHDVKILPFNPDDLTVTPAERRSIDIKRLTVTPRGDGTVRFKVKIGQVLIGTRFWQDVQIEFKRVSASTDGWIAAYILLHLRPHFPPQAYMLVPGPTQQVSCTPQRFRADPDTDTFSADIPNECIPLGDAKVNLTAFTRYTKAHNTTNMSIDKLWGSRAAVR